MKHPIKLFLLTGFLGSGKTTLLKQLIESIGKRRIGVIMNEFGKISIDGPIIRKNGIEILEINNGSIFCSCLKGSFIEGLVAYSELPIDCLLVETSGMADPSSIENILNNFVGRVKGKAFDYRGTVCIVDARYFLDQVDLLVAIEKQVAAGSLILINKCDLVDEDILEEVEAKVKEINSRAAILRTIFGNIDPLLLETVSPLSVTGAEAESCNTPLNRPMGYFLKTNGVFPREELTAFLRGLSPFMIRVKGFFRLSEGWNQIDAVGDTINIVPSGIERESSELVIISLVDHSMLGTIQSEWDRRFSQKMTVEMNA
jgi:G3E family GTPase